MVWYGIILYYLNDYSYSADSGDAPLPCALGGLTRTPDKQFRQMQC